MEVIDKPLEAKKLTYNEMISKAMHKQAIVNIGAIGHVSNGKTTLTRDLSGVVTQKSKIELQSNKTVKLGYANAKIFMCDFCDAPECYQSTGSNEMVHLCTICGCETILVSHISISDVPGHNHFMSTMLNGTCVMDKAILVESFANDENMPAPQTVEHFNIIKEVGIETILVCLNKVDLMMKTKQKIQPLIDKMRDFTGGNIPIVPISGSMACNIDVVCEYLANLEVPKKDLDSPFKMIVVRSFNCNYPNVKISELKGGILGGSLMRGVIRVDDEIIVFPGLLTKQEKKDKHDIGWRYYPLQCKVISINSEKNSLDYAIPGGFVGVQLDIDPGMACGDSLVGHLMFKKTDNMSNVKVYEAIKLDYHPIKGEIHEIKKKDRLSINANSNNVGCEVCKVSKNSIVLLLDSPICVELNDKVTVSLPLPGDASHIHGYGTVSDGADCELIQ
jgi:translation initiation factor 2 subunit 3